jgi:hypothetical protein
METMSSVVLCALFVFRVGMADPFFAGMFKLESFETARAQLVDVKRAVTGNGPIRADEYLMLACVPFERNQ